MRQHATLYLLILAYVNIQRTASIAKHIGNRASALLMIFTGVKVFCKRKQCIRWRIIDNLFKPLFHTIFISVFVAFP
ncbi:DUF1418 family protein [Alteromonas portus]|uniref:DUF1418 family protein n=1 Tax=Alteromonas portus TaxID=2565549 RepID=UPI003B8313AE